MNETLKKKEVREDLEEVRVPQEAKITGSVAPGVFLNVRSNGAFDAKIIGVVDSKHKLTIDKPKSNKQFYKVSVGTLFDGFCLKKYITLDDDKE